MSKQFTLNLLGEFAVYRDMEPLVLPPSCRRLVALAAVKRRELHRSWVCDLLWPGSPPQKAVSSLRSALWRLRPLGADSLLVVRHQYVSLAPEVKVDWHDALALHEARTVTEGRPVPAPAQPVLHRLMRSGDLLEGWPDPWCVAERDRYRAIRRSVLATPEDAAPRQVTHYAAPGAPHLTGCGGRHQSDNAGCLP
ncbi:AfsR/SARP family transcriptional regulator [Mycolicibacterium neworleansense]|uniref:Transcriptional regulator n=1 Tax=Mycolicibacterium neworleansense TaxID=146018 RepID=A0A0H5RGT7_9MYCO|nr:transcriptional regulator [Mycolicibacterium neworleansense]MCV7362238.1 transcriptional regulator [Mycolicibacterium neworleansense]CRZ13355.1 transcriptional regulator [Mycolicibacterium neworleansense]